MTTINLRGISISFPFEPYELQKNYMEKVIECLQNQTHAVLESPTGTGKTLSLLCSTLAWLQMKKAQVQAERQSAGVPANAHYLETIKNELEGITNSSAIGRALSGVPLVIYSSRTHTQLSQAMQELKRSSYSYMKACVMGSRDQLCIHDEVSQQENNGLKTQMCRMKVSSRSCHYYNKVQSQMENPALKSLSVIDIEDLVKVGTSHKFCPYYMSKVLIENADIVFMPYNYLLDPIFMKRLGVYLTNTVVILDEAHNVERMCEEAGSIQLKSSDIALAIDEVTGVMKLISEEVLNFDDSPKDFTPDDLCILKKMLLDLEEVLDNIKVGQEGQTFEGTFIFDIFEKVGINLEGYFKVMALLKKIIQFLSTTSEGPFARKGNGLQHLEEVLQIIFFVRSDDYKDKVKMCFKVHVTDEVKKKKSGSWQTKAITKAGKVLNYWCFSPSFGMNIFMTAGIKSLILTSGTLAPLKPLISELELKVDVKLENPHIITGEQICVKIVPAGPDKQPLNCNFYNRGNEDYVRSLGMSVFNLSKIIPDGLLVFFPSYPIMQNCQEVWQMKGIWSNIYSQKPIFVEPRNKNSFKSVMQEYYQKINDPDYKGAIFMGVCRGKVSEGLDFIDANGRAVLVIGLPYPPYKDPRIILKKKYLDFRNTLDKQFLRGDDWYGLEATKAVNQAIGRVIRHRNDYGAILLLDERFNNPRVKDHMSKWLKHHIKIANNFGELMKDVKLFFRNAEAKFPCTESKSKKTITAEFDLSKTYKLISGEASTSTAIDSASSSNGEVIIHQRNKTNPNKKMKITIMKQKFMNVEEEAAQDKEDKATAMKEYIAMIKKNFNQAEYQKFVAALRNYKDTLDFTNLKVELDEIFKGKYHLRYLILGLETYIKSQHKKDFQIYCEGNV